MSDQPLVDKQTGISIRMVKEWDITKDTAPPHYDVLVEQAALELAIADTREVPFATKIGDATRFLREQREVKRPWTVTHEPIVEVQTQQAADLDNLALSFSSSELWMPPPVEFSRRAARWFARLHRLVVWLQLPDGRTMRPWTWQAGVFRLLLRTRYHQWHFQEKMQQFQREAVQKIADSIDRAFMDTMAAANSMGCIAPGTTVDVPNTFITQCECLWDDGPRARAHSGAALIEDVADPGCPRCHGTGFHGVL